MIPKQLIDSGYEPGAGAALTDGELEGIAGGALSADDIAWRKDQVAYARYGLHMSYDSVWALFSETEENLTPEEMEQLKSIVQEVYGIKA